MIASLNIMAKMFVGLLVTIIATRRRPIFILHLKAKYAKMDCKNEIYVKNWLRSTWIVKIQPLRKVNGQVQPSVKVNGQLW